VALTLVAFVSFCLIHAAGPQTRTLVFPLVVQGAFGSVQISTVLRITNLQGEAVTVRLSSYRIDLPSDALQLAPGEAREIAFEAVEATSGWVSIEVATPVSASARVSARSVAEPGKLVSELYFAAVEKGSKWVIPVFDYSRQASELSLAIAAIQPAPLRVTLRNGMGEAVATRDVTWSLLPLERQFAVFLSELFPEVPDGFLSGDIVIEELASPEIPQVFSVIAARVVGENWTSLPGTRADIPGRYLLRIEPGAAMIEELSAQYGFEVVEFLPLSQVYLVRMTDEVARAVARDPRVVVEPDQLVLPI
jgi:hypothetical protein